MTQLETVRQGRINRPVYLHGGSGANFSLHCWLKTADCRLPTADCQLPTTNYQMLTTSSSPPLRVCFFSSWTTTATTAVVDVCISFVRSQRRVVGTLITILTRGYFVSFLSSICTNTARKLTVWLWWWLRKSSCHETIV